MASLMRFNPWKGKFENDAAFAKRMREVSGERLLDGIKVGDVVAFRIPKVLFQYDANKQEWRYFVNPENVGDRFSYVVYDVIGCPFVGSIKSAVGCHGLLVGHAMLPSSEPVTAAVNRIANL